MLVVPVAVNDTVRLCCIRAAPQSSAVKMDGGFFPHGSRGHSCGSTGLAGRLFRLRFCSSTQAFRWAHKCPRWELIGKK